MFDIYLNQNNNNPTYLFHGSPILLSNLEPKQSHDSNNNSHNIDTAIFLTSSFLTATAYAFKDTIKQCSLANNLKYDFSINSHGEIPILVMNNVIVPDNLKGYIYVFKYDDKFTNDPQGSLQYKYYGNLEPIKIINVNYNDFKQYYENVSK